MSSTVPFPAALRALARLLRSGAPAVPFAAAIFALAAPTLAQYGDDAPLGQKASAELFARAEGDELRLAIAIEIDAGFHLYHEELGAEDAVGKPTIVTIEAEGATFGPVRFPEPHRYEQPSIGAGGRDTWILGHEGEIVLYARGAVDGADAFDAGSIVVEIRGLTCQDDGSCVPYDEVLEVSGPGDDALFAAFPADLAASGGGAAPAGGASAGGAGVVAGASPRADVDYDAVTFPELSPREGLDDVGVEDRGLLVWLLLAFVAGAILNVMPCVLPVISIKVLSFVQQAGEDKRRVLHLGIAFAAGIVVVFWALAVAAIALGLTWGEQFQSEGFLVTMVAIVFALSLSLFGVFELGVPAGVGSLAGVRREGLGDAFAKGMLATVLATPCSGPFLGSTLTWTLAQPWTAVLAIFTALGLGMAIPYVVLTAQPALLRRLPRPGPWMDTFKQAMGFVMLATVVFLLISVPQDLLLFTAAFLVFVALGCWWYGRFATFDKGAGRRFAHLVVALAIAGSGARLSFVEFRGLFEADPAEWVAFDHEALERHLADGQSVFIDFTANWCATCQLNKAVFNAPDVRAVMAERGVVAMKADLTNDSAYTRMIERLRDQLGSKSIPFLAVFPADRPTEPIVERDLVSKATMLEIFRSLPAP